LARDAVTDGSRKETNLFDRILAAIDLGPSTDDVLMHAARWSREFHATVAVCHVTPLLTTSNMLFPQVNAPRALGSLEQERELQERLARHVGRFTADLGRPIDTFLELGSAEDEIVRRAEVFAARLVVVAAGAHLGIAHRLVRGVAASVGAKRAFLCWW
jgi:nucleotide-binding universal stress UspA family protein